MIKSQCLLKSDTTKNRRGWGSISVVRQLPSRCEALGWIPNNPKGKKNSIVNQFSTSGSVNNCLLYVLPSVLYISTNVIHLVPVQVYESVTFNFHFIDEKAEAH